MSDFIFKLKSFQEFTKKWKIVYQIHIFIHWQLKIQYCNNSYIATKNKKVYPLSVIGVTSLKNVTNIVDIVHSNI